MRTSDFGLTLLDMKRILKMLGLAWSVLALGDTPPQIINKTCSVHEWFESIVPGQTPVCTQPQYSDIGGTPTVAWGSITGTLANQSDLQSALNAKQNSLSFGNFTASSPFSISGGTGAVIGSGTVLGVASGFYFPTTTDQSNWNSKQAAGNYLTQLTGDVSASGPGSAAATLATVNSNVGNFTNANITVNAKGLITAAANGSAGGVTSVTATAPIVSSGGSTPNLTCNVASGSQSGCLASFDWITFNGKQAAGSYITALTGDVAASGPGSASSTIQTNVVTDAKLAQIGAHSYHGNNTGSTANVANITNTQLTADLNQFTSSLQGLVPGSGGGTSNFLRADGSWAAPSGGSGTVTSVGLSVPATSIFGVSGSPVTTSGTLGLTTTGTSGGGAYFSSTSQLASTALLAQHAPLVGGGAASAFKSISSTGTSGQALLSAGSSTDPSYGTLGVGGGGTGLTSGTSGGILGFTATGTLASSAALTNHAIVLGAGAGATPTALGSLGTSNTLLHGNSTGAPNFSGVSLTADIVSGSHLPLINSGNSISNAESLISLAAGGIPSSPWNDFPLESAYSSWLVFEQTPANYNISGMTHDGTAGQTVTMQNLGGTTNLYLGGSGSSAGNGFCPTTGTYLILPPGGTVTWIYEQTNACWVNITPGQIDYGNSPGSVSTFDYNNWNSKQDAISGTNNSIPYWSSGFQFNPSSLRFDPQGNWVGFNDGGTEVPAGLYIGTPNPITIGNVTSGGAFLVNIQDGYSAPSAASMSVDESGGSYGPSNGSTYEYGYASCVLYNGNCYGTSGTTTTMADNNDGLNFQWDLFYTDSGASSTIITCLSGPCLGGPQQASNGAGNPGPFVDPGGLFTNAPPFLNASSYGITATGGSVLAEPYYVYGYNSTYGIYSATPLIITPGDPADNNNYLGELNWAACANCTSYVIANYIGNTVSVSGTSYQLDATSSFSGPPATPSSLAAPALKIQSGTTIGPSWNIDGSGNGTFNTVSSGLITATGGIQISAGQNIISTTTGTEIATASTQKLGFFGTTPVVQQTGDISTGLSNLGLITSGTVSNASLANAPAMFISGQTGAITGISANEIIGYGKFARAATFESIQGSANTFTTCSTNPTFTLYDCGTSAGACTSGTTAKAAITLTATGGANGTVSSANIAAGHYWAIEITAGACAALNAGITAEYKMQ